MELIDKDALVAEIEKRLDELWDLLPNASDVIKDNYTKEEANITGKYTALESFEKFINTLEVKEVDFEKELDRIWFDNKLGNYFDNDALDFAHVRTICKHFFELGLKAKSMIGNDDSNPS